MLCYTGEPRNSGTNNWEITKRHIDGDRHVFDCFERIRDTAAAMREALERGDWDAVGRAIAEEWENRKRLAPGVTTPAIDDADRAGARRPARPPPRCAAPAAAAACSATARPSGGASIREALAAGGARAARLHVRAPRADAWITASIAQVLGEIADLLEIKGENAFKIRAYRSAADTIAAWPDAVARMDDAQLREIPGIGKDLAAQDPRAGRDRRCAYHQELLAGVSADDPRPAAPAGRRAEDGGAALRDARHPQRSTSWPPPRATGGCARCKGMGAKKEALILKAVEERQTDAGRHLLADDGRGRGRAASAYLRERAPGVEFMPVGSLRRGCETCGDIDILAIGGDAER